LKSNDLQFKKIGSIRKIVKPCKVYNFSVPQYETYIAGGLSVHNCQNFTVSQTVKKRSSYQSTEDLVQLSESKGTAGISFTYNEPTIYYEYVRDVSRHCKVVLKTNGFVNAHILDQLDQVAAWNVDIKGDEAEYDRVCGGSLGPVMSTIEHLAHRSHLEVSYLVLPRMVKDINYHLKMSAWLSSLSPDIPVHLLYFYPVHRMEDEFYEQDCLLPIYDLFCDKMNYVYISNVYGPVARRNTVCPDCGRILVERNPKPIVYHDFCCGRKVTYDGASPVAS